MTPTKDELQTEVDALTAVIDGQAKGTVSGVHLAIHNILRDMPDIERRRVQTFKAFNVDDVYATLRPLMVRHGLILLPVAQSAVYDKGTFAKGTEFVDSRVHMTYDLIAVADGTRERIGFMAEGRDTQDKATNKAAQQALKYALIQMFLINTGEDAEEDPGKGDTAQAPRPGRAVTKAEPTAESVSKVDQLTHAAQAHVLRLVGGSKAEAKKAWPLMLEKAGVAAVKTEEDRDTVMTAANDMFAPADEEPFT